MNPSVVRIIGLVQLLSLWALLAVLVRPKAPWSLRARVLVTVIAFFSSAADLFLRIL